MLRRLLHLELDRIFDPLDRLQAPLVQRVLLASLAPGIATFPAEVMLWSSTPYRLFVWSAIVLLIGLSLAALVVPGAVAIALTMHSFVVMEGLRTGAAPVIGLGLL